MRNKNRSPKKRKGHQRIVQSSKTQSEKIRYGAPDGPRPEGSKNYDGHTPLEWPGHEAMARHLAVPKSQREFKSDKDMAKYFQVDRMTLYRWKKDINVIKRAHWLAMQNKTEGELVVRREYVPIAEKAAKMAREGNITAMKFCAALAFPEDKRAIKSGITSLSLEEIRVRDEIEQKENEEMDPTWLKRQLKRRSTDRCEPDADSACGVCGKTYCAHGQCPMCETCKLCKQPSL